MGGVGSCGSSSDALTSEGAVLISALIIGVVDGAESGLVGLSRHDEDLEPTIGRG